MQTPASYASFQSSTILSKTGRTRREHPFPINERPRPRRTKASTTKTDCIQQLQPCSVNTYLATNTRKTGQTYIISRKKERKRIPHKKKASTKGHNGRASPIHIHIHLRSSHRHDHRTRRILLLLRRRKPRTTPPPRPITRRRTRTRPERKRKETTKAPPPDPHLPLPLLQPPPPRLDAGHPPSPAATRARGRRGPDSALAP